MLTDDENIIDMQFAVQYNLKSAEDYVFNNRNPDEIVAFVAETAIREVVGKSKMDFVLYEGREQIAATREALMQQILDRYGPASSCRTVTLQSVQPPEQVQAAFDDAVKAGQDRERLKNEGQAYANDVVPRARGMAARLLEEAQRLPDRGRAARRGRRVALPPDPRRIPEGARRHARAHVPRHDAVGARQHEQGDGRPEERRQPALPAARQADAAGAPPRRARPTVPPARARAPRRSRPSTIDPSRTRDSLRTATPAMRAPILRGSADMRIGCRSLAIVVAILLVASQSLYTVDQRKYAIKFQLGEVVDGEDRAGPLLQGAAAAERASSTTRAS